MGSHRAVAPALRSPSIGLYEAFVAHCVWHVIAETANPCRRLRKSLALRFWPCDSGPVIDVDAFMADGFVKIEQPALRAAGDEARALLWEQLGLSPDHPEEWSTPVQWTSDLTGGGPFAHLVSNQLLADALNQVCGVGGWTLRGALGNIPVRFPVSPPADDRGWHIDANTRTSDGAWWVSGRPQTVLLLTLLSEIGPADAPTRIRVGSHYDVAAALGAEPLDPFEAGPLVDRVSKQRPIIQATGSPGDMYLVHPFTVHAADEHRGHTPRFMAQAPIVLTSTVTPASPSLLAHVFDD